MTFNKLVPPQRALANDRKQVLAMRTRAARFQAFVATRNRSYPSNVYNETPGTDLAESQPAEACGTTVSESSFVKGNLKRDVKMNLDKGLAADEDVAQVP